LTFFPSPRKLASSTSPNAKEAIQRYIRSHLSVAETVIQVIRTGTMKICLTTFLALDSVVAARDYKVTSLSEIGASVKKEDESYWNRLMQQTEMSVAPPPRLPTLPVPTEPVPTVSSVSLSVCLRSLANRISPNFSYLSRRRVLVLLPHRQ
jgi:hypothetical protein